MHCMWKTMWLPENMAFEMPDKHSSLLRNIKVSEVWYTIFKKSTLQES